MGDFSHGEIWGRAQRWMGGGGWGGYAFEMEVEGEIICAERQRERNTVKLRGKQGEITEAAGWKLDLLDLS